MKKDNLQNKTTDKLKAELKGIQIVSGALVGVLTVLFAITIYGMLTKEDNTTFIALLSVGISCSAILPLQFSNMKKIKHELKLRSDK